MLSTKQQLLWNIMSPGQPRPLRVHLRGWQEIGDWKKKHMQWQLLFSHNREPRCALAEDPTEVTSVCVFVCIFTRRLHLTIPGILRIYTPQPGKDRKVMNKMFLHRLLSCPLLWSLHTPSPSEAGLSTAGLTTAQRFPVWYCEKIVVCLFFVIILFLLFKLGKIVRRLYLLLE